MGAISTPRLSPTRAALARATLPAHHNLRRLVVGRELALKVDHDLVQTEPLGRRKQAVDGLGRLVLDGDVAGGGVGVLGKHGDRDADRRLGRGHGRSPLGWVVVSAGRRSRGVKYLRGHVRAGTDDRPLLGSATATESGGTAATRPPPTHTTADARRRPR